MAKVNERIDIFVCDSCQGGLPPCKLEVPTENPDETAIPDQCIFSCRKKGFIPKWQLVGSIPISFDWDYSYVLRNKNGEQHG
jgi:hypothetical protein